MPHNESTEKSAMRFPVGAVSAAAAVFLLCAVLAVTARGAAVLVSPGVLVRWLVLALVAAVLWQAVVRALWRIWRLPTLPPGLRGDLAEMTPDALRRLARALEQGRGLAPEEKRHFSRCLDIGAPVAPLLEQWLADRKKGGREVLVKYAARAGLVTGLSQNGALDALTVLVLSFSMLRDLYASWGVRPALPALLRAYITVLINALLAGAVEQLDPAALLRLGVPGRLVESAFQAVMNAGLMLRFGLLAQELVFADGRLCTETRRRAFKDAITMLPGVVKHVLPEMKGLWTTLASLGRGKSQDAPVAPVP